jgi:small neutral amino acid transporter SnatA (MarC family)
VAVDAIGVLTVFMILPFGIAVFKLLGITISDFMVAGDILFWCGELGEANGTQGSKQETIQQVEYR